jgi:hypothetical protein
VGYHHALATAERVPARAVAAGERGCRVHRRVIGFAATAIPATANLSFATAGDSEPTVADTADPGARCV